MYNEGSLNGVPFSEGRGKHYHPRPGEPTHRSTFSLDYLMQTREVDGNLGRKEEPFVIPVGRSGWEIIMFHLPREVIHRRKVAKFGPVSNLNVALPHPPRCGTLAMISRQLLISVHGR